MKRIDPGLLRLAETGVRTAGAVKQVEQKTGMYVAFGVIGLFGILLLTGKLNKPAPAPELVVRGTEPWLSFEFH